MTQEFLSGEQAERRAASTPACASSGGRPAYPSDERLQ